MKQQHPNTIVYITDLTDRKHNQGTIVAYAGVPFLARVVSVHEYKGAVHTAYEPVSAAEMREHYAHMYRRDPDETDEDWRRQEVRNRCMEKRQGDWWQGLPYEATIYCDNCRKQRPAHGHHCYESVVLCNQCSERFELDCVMERAAEVSSWVRLNVRVLDINQAIKKAQSRGGFMFPLDNDTYADILTLYRREDAVTSSYYVPYREDHWPEGLAPQMYTVIIRSSIDSRALHARVVCPDEYELSDLLFDGWAQLVIPTNTK